MAEIIGDPGRSAGEEVFVRFRRMFLIAFVPLFISGITLGQMIGTKGHLNVPSVVSAPVILILLAAVYMFYSRANKLMNLYEGQRRNWRKGADGEAMVSDMLRNLPDDYVVINDITKKLGNIDHVVIGPTGVYVLNTKKWRGAVQLGSNDELLLNGRPTDKPEVGNLVHATMDFHDKIKVLCEKEEFIHGLMVFVDTYVEGSSSSKKHMHLVRDDKLIEYLQKGAVRLKAGEIARIRRAVLGMACMDERFAES
jgi:hypothetical protein